MNSCFSAVVQEALAPACKSAISVKIVDIVFPCPVISEEFELILLKFEVIVFLEFPTKNVLGLIVLKFDVIVAFKLLIKKN